MAEEVAIPKFTSVSDSVEKTVKGFGASISIFFGNASDSVNKALKSISEPKLTKEQADIAQETLTGQFKRLEDLRFDILASFALHQEDPVLSAIVQGRPSQIFDPSRVNAAVTAFIGRSNALQNVSQNGGYGGGPIGANRFRNAKRQFAQQSIGRLGVFMARLVRGEPITIGEADNFASNILGEARLESTLATLGTTVSKEFKADNIDTRNEVLRLEALAYKIERDEASAIA